RYRFLSARDSKCGSGLRCGWRRSSAWTGGRVSRGWSEASAPRSWEVRGEGSGSMWESESAPSPVAGPGAASGFIGARGLIKSELELVASVVCPGTIRASNAGAAASRSLARRPRRDVDFSSAILTPVQPVLREVLHDSVGYELPDGRTVHDPLSAIRG